MGFYLVTLALCTINAFLLFWCSGCMSLTNETDRLALLAFKFRITSDPFHVVSSWNDSIPHCKWAGVICGGSRHPDRVKVLRLRSNGLVGSLAPEIGNLSFIQVIQLENNSFHGDIPSEVSSLFRLRYLYLYINSFDGEIPPNISRCSNLRVLSLGVNNLVGKIPIKLGSLSNLKKLALRSNRLKGQIPTSLGNISSLEIIAIPYNDISGSIPDSLGRNTKLKWFFAGTNKLSGAIPPITYNLSLLSQFDVGMNELQGSLPPTLGFSLPNLQFFSISENHFFGQIPTSISNLSKLDTLEVGGNNFTGKVDVHFGGLRKLIWLSLDLNHLGNGEASDLNFVSTLTNCSSLTELYFGGNQFGGMIPKSIANLSTQLTVFSIAENQIFGNIPMGIENLVSLQALELFGNLLEGSITASIGSLRMLHRLNLSKNRFIGPIPFSVGNLTLLIELFLNDNQLQGEIPSSLGNSKDMLRLSLSRNNFSNIIPKEIFALSTLIVLDLSWNSLFGSLPSDVHKLTSLEILNVSNNMLSGEIPSAIGACTSLELLHLEGNIFHGSVPSSLSSLRGLQELDLSHNNLSGIVPKYLATFKFLQNLNLSFNHLEGELPTDGVFRNLSAISIIGNDKLCGGIPEIHLQKCLTPKSKDGRHHVFKLIVIICASGGSLFLISMIFLVVFCRVRKEKKETNSFLVEGRHFKISYAQLRKATDEFLSTNLIGVGSSGSVYKGILNDGETIVAVKVLNIGQRGASKSFMAECESLRNIRHRNLVKIITSCSSIDFEGNDFKALIYEFMPGGSLETWLHPHTEGTQDAQRHLSIAQRLNIAIDMATALDYLHHHCYIQIIHCDLKPSNVLLDGDLTAKLSDFGISRILSKATGRSQNHMSSIGIKGSIGYIAPEYGAGVDVSTYGDVYSFGILLLEMFTGKRPTHEMFKDNFNLHYWAEMALHDGVMAVVDPSLLSMEEDNEEITTIVPNINISHRCIEDRVQECLISIIRIGVSCSTESPRNRMNITDVIKELHLARDMYLGVGTHQRR